MNKMSRMDDDKPGTEPEIVLENEFLKLTVLPEWGGKINSLKSKRTGVEYLCQPGEPLAGVQKPSYGDTFLPPHACGFDECFPTVSECDVQTASKNVHLPDHGELWSRPWYFEKRENTLRLWIEGKALGYRFTKTVQLSGPSVRIGYKLTSLEKKPFDFIWSSHPLLEIESGDRIFLPHEVKSVQLYWSSDSEIGEQGDDLPWPTIRVGGNGDEFDYSTVSDQSVPFAAKLFTGRLHEGRAALYKTKPDETLQFTFNQQEIPYLGIWLCYHGWPEDSPVKDFTVALEPCSAPLDSLAEAVDYKNSSVINPEETLNWSIDIEILNGLPSRK